ncbi:hypothetical protein CCMSSC00406_0007096 [Pleurotus cornucopiae]|uniref:Uncharacterized protein n=1 Tax=Pleurotus cornucopiae TaxID=5321 RepID=A0ACB7J4R9_PLECO|nr:hypothetical protein CCMSSC00406_0007096 [Pleurotus cornucopiae]
MNIAVEAHRACLSRLTTYVASARLLSNLSWKAVKTEFVLVDDVAADPVMEPLELVIVGQVSHSVSHLDPLGNFSAQFDNMARAKFAFEIELPTNPAFTADYYKAVSTLRRLQRDAAKSSDVRHLLVDGTTNSNIKFTAPLFRRKLDGLDSELLPEGSIADDPNDPDYFPTAANWPVPFVSSRPFQDMLDTHIFQPLHVFTAVGKRIPSDEFARKLPGSLVEVHFTLHHWYFARDRFDSFNAHAKQIIIIKDTAVLDRSRLKRKAVRGINRRDDSEPETKRDKDEGAIEDVVVDDKPFVKAKTASPANETMDISVKGANEEGVTVKPTGRSKGKAVAKS